MAQLRRRFPLLGAWSLALARKLWDGFNKVRRHPVTRELFFFGVGWGFVALLWGALADQDIVNHVKTAALEVGPEIKPLAQTLPASLSILILLTLASIFISRPIAAFLLFLLDKFDAFCLDAATRWHERKNEEAREEYGSNNKTHLDWPDVTSFLMTERYNSIVSRLQRLELLDGIELGMKRPAPEMRRRVRAIIDVLYLTRGALSRTGKRYDLEHEATVSDDRGPLRRRIVQLERFIAVMAMSRVFRVAVQVIPPALMWVLLIDGSLQPVWDALGWSASEVSAAVAASTPSAAGQAAEAFGRAIGAFLPVNGLNSVDEFRLWGFEALGAFVAVTAATACVALAAFHALTVVWTWIIGASSQVLQRLANVMSWVLMFCVAIFLIQAWTDAEFEQFLASDSVAMQEIFHLLNFIQLVARPGSDLKLVFGEPTEVAEQIFLMRVVVALVAGLLIYALVRFLAVLFEFSPQARLGGGMALPPDLVMIAGGFAVFIVVTLMLYTAGLEYLELESARTSDPGAPGLSANVVPGDILAQDFIPYSVFLAIVGAVMALATRELLENYFSGLAFRVDNPFEIGDRVVINDGEMAEVRRIGVRAVEFYAIRSNSILSYTHKDLSNAVIQNYTQPNFDFRRSISIDVPLSFEQPNGELGDQTLLTRLEKLMLIAGLSTAGVKKAVIGPYSSIILKNNFQILFNVQRNDLPVFFGPQKFSGKNEPSSGNTSAVRAKYEVPKNYERLTKANFPSVTALKVNSEQFYRKQKGDLILKSGFEALKEAVEEVLSTELSSESVRKEIERISRERSGEKDLEAFANLVTKVEVAKKHADEVFRGHWLAFNAVDRERGGKLFKRLHVDNVVRQLDEVCKTLSRQSNDRSREDERSAGGKAQTADDRHRSNVAVTWVDVDTSDVVFDNQFDPALSKFSAIEGAAAAASLQQAIRALIMRLLLAQAEFEESLDRALGVTRPKPEHDPENWEARLVEHSHRLFADVELAKRGLTPDAYRQIAEPALTISRTYAQIAIEMWRLREIPSRQISNAAKRDIDRACVDLLTPPRVSSERRISENGEPYWRVTLHVTVETAEQSEEILHNVNRLISRLWSAAGLPPEVAASR